MKLKFIIFFTVIALANARKRGRSNDRPAKQPAGSKRPSTKEKLVKYQTNIKNLIKLPLTNFLDGNQIKNTPELLSV